MTILNEKIKHSPLIKEYCCWLNEYIHPNYVNITDLLQDKIEQGKVITTNDIRMAKYSGAMQFLSICLTKKDDTSILILSTMESIVENIKFNDWWKTFLEENKEFLKLNDFVSKDKEK